MNIYYSARGTFAWDYDEFGLNWDGYTHWQRLSTLEEVVSVDEVLNRDLMRFNQKNLEDWKYVVTHGIHRTNFYKSLDYVMKKVMPK